MARKKLGEPAGMAEEEILKKDKRRKKFEGNNKSKKAKNSPEGFLARDEKLAAEIQQAQTGEIAESAEKSPDNRKKNFKERVGDKFESMKKGMNEEVYNEVKSQLPEDIRDLYDKSAIESKKKSKQAETNQEKDVIHDVSFQGIYQIAVNEWLRKNGKKYNELQEEDINKLREEAWEEFKEKFPDLAKKYEGYEKRTDRMEEEQKIIDEAWKEKAGRIKLMSATKTMEDVERDRAKKAQKEINNTKFEEPEEETETGKSKNKTSEKKKPFTGKKREEPEIVDAEFIEHKPLEITDQNWRGERKEGIKKLQKELEQARKDYLEMDYKKRGMWQKVGRFFGDKIFGRKGREEVSMKAGEKTGDMIVDDQDVVYMRALYENKLVDLRNAMLEDAKAKGMKAEDLAEMGKFFEVESRVNLADEHDKVRVENSGRFAGPLRENLVKMNEWYRKQPLKYKLAVGAAFGLGGAAASFGLIAGSAATALTMAAISRRAVMGAITGTGASIFAEGMAKKGREKRAEKGSEKFAREAENLSEEEIKNKLNELIFSADDKLQSYKNWDKIRLAAGGAIAGIIGSGAMGEIFKFLHKTEAGKATSEAVHKMAGILKSSISETAPGPGVPNGAVGGGNATVESGGKAESAVFGNNETIENAGTLAPDNNATIEKNEAKISGKTIPGSKPEVPKNINLEIKKGGSFEGAIIKQLESGGTNKKEAGKMAHRMYLEYIKSHPDPTGKEYNLVHPGAKLELSPDGKRIVDFKDSPLSEWDKYPGAKGTDQHKSGRAPRAPKIEAVSEKINTEAFDFEKTYQDLSGMKAMEREMLDIRARERGFEGFSYGKSKAELAYLDDQIVQNQNRMKFYGNPELLDGKERDIAKGFKETLEDLMKRKMALEFKIHDWERFKELNELFSGSTSKVFNKIAKLALFEAGAHEEFSLEKMAAAEYVGKHPKGNFGKFYKDCVKIYGKKEIQPIAGENMKEWAGRVTKLIVKRRMMSEN